MIEGHCCFFKFSYDILIADIVTSLFVDISMRYFVDYAYEIRISEANVYGLLAMERLENLISCARCMNLFWRPYFYMYSGIFNQSIIIALVYGRVS